MAKRKADTLSRQEDPAAKYRAKLEARKAATHEAQATRWSPGIRNCLTLTFARLLYTATAPTTRAGGLRKRFLERWLFRAATQHAAHRKVLYRASKAVLSASRAGDLDTFNCSGNELRRLYREARVSSRAGKARERFRNRR
jgi:hypothetical protein